MKFINPLCFNCAAITPVIRGSKANPRMLSWGVLVYRQE